MQEVRPVPQLCGKRTRICSLCDQHYKLHKRGEITGHEFTPKPCTKWAMENGACMLHGGKSAVGVGHPNWKGKGTSKIMVLPSRLRADYEAARNDPERLSLDNEIATVRALADDEWRLLEADASIAVNAVRAAAGEVHKAYTKAFVAHRAGNAEKFAEAMNELGEADQSLRAALNPVVAYEAAKAKVAELALKTNKLVRSENMRVFEERGMVSVEAALADRHALVLLLIKAVEKHVADTAIQTAIRRTVGTEYARLTGRRDTPAAPAPGGPEPIDAQYSPTTD